MKAEFFKKNREHLLELFNGTVPIVLTANGPLQRSMDSTFPFAQDGNFWYLTGIAEPNVVLVMDMGHEYLIVPQLSSVREAFDGAIDTEALKKMSGIEEILYEKDGWERLGTRLKKTRSAAILPPAPAFVEQLGMYTNPARRRLIEEMKRINPKVTFLDLRPVLQRMRMVKHPEELAAIKRAVDITVDSLKVIKRKYMNQRYDNEFDIELDLTHEFSKRGASGHSFTPIVAAGARASQVHPVGNNGPISSKDALLMDVGAEYDHYAADLTRTWSRQPTKRLRAVHESVLEVQNYAFNLLKPGVLLRDYEKQIETFMGKKLKELGLIKTAKKDSIRKYYPHTTSHFLGVDVHDYGNTEYPLVAGVVLTVEPGIYIPEEGIGVRIEDDVVITENGVEVLSVNLPSSVL